MEDQNRLDIVTELGELLARFMFYLLPNSEALRMTGPPLCSKG